MKLNRKAIDAVDFEVVNNQPIAAERVAISAFIQELKSQTKGKRASARPIRPVKA